MTSPSKQKLDFEKFRGLPKYRVFDDVLDLLLSNGNQLTTEYRWGSNPTGYFAILQYPIDFEIVEENFEIPPSVNLNKEYGEIDYGLGTVIIRSQTG